MDMGSRAITGDDSVWSFASTTSSSSSDSNAEFQKDTFSDILGKISDMFDRRAIDEIPEGMRLDFVPTRRPQINYFDLTYIARAPSSLNSSFDVCVYYTHDNSNVDSEDGSLLISSLHEPTLDISREYGPSMKLVPQGFISSEDPQLQLMQREAPLRRLMKLTRTELRANSFFEKRSQSTSAHNLSTPQSPGTSIFHFSLSQEFFEVPAKPRPLPVYSVPSPSSAYITSLGHLEQIQTHIDDDDELGSTDTSYIVANNRPRCPRLQLVKHLVRKVLPIKTGTRPDASEDDVRTSGLYINSWASSTGSLSGWTTVSRTSK